MGVSHRNDTEAARGGAGVEMWEEGTRDKGRHPASRRSQGSRGCHLASHRSAVVGSKPEGRDHEFLVPCCFMAEKKA